MRRLKINRDRFSNICRIYAMSFLIIVLSYDMSYFDNINLFTITIIGRLAMYHQYSRRIADNLPRTTYQCVLISVVCKTMESLIRDQIMDHLINN